MIKDTMNFMKATIKCDLVKVNRSDLVSREIVLPDQITLKMGDDPDNLEVELESNGVLHTVTGDEFVILVNGEKSVRGTLPVTAMLTTAAAVLLIAK